MEQQIKKLITSQLNKSSHVKPELIKIIKFDKRLFKIYHNGIFISWVNDDDLLLMNTVNFKKMNCLTIINNITQTIPSLIILNYCTSQPNTEYLTRYYPNITTLNVIPKNSLTNSAINYSIKNNNDLIVVEDDECELKNINHGLWYLKQSRVGIMLLHNDYQFTYNFIKRALNVVQNGVQIIGTTLLNYSNASYESDKNCLYGIGYLPYGLVLTKLILDKFKWQLDLAETELVLSVNRTIKLYSPIKCSTNSLPLMSGNL